MSSFFNTVLFIQEFTKELILLWMGYYVWIMTQLLG